jgi:outer membrane protein TolC
MYGPNSGDSYGTGRVVVLGLCVAVICWTMPARAQELRVFLEAAKKHNYDARESAALAEQRAAEARQTAAGLLPTFTAQGNYIRNQYAAEAIAPTTPGGRPERVTIFPRNQLQGLLQVDMPLVDVTRWAQVRVDNTVATAARQRARATDVNVEGSVIQAYYNLLGAQALVKAATQSISATEVIVARTKERVAAGVASPVDEARAVSELSLKRQTLADAEQGAAVAARTLETLTGVMPKELVKPPLDDLHAEPPAENWYGEFDQIPAVLATQSDARAARQRSDAAWTVFVPTLSFRFTEQFTNATGFANRPIFYTGFLTLTEKFDWSAVQAMRAQRAAADAAEARRDKATQDVHDTIFSNWQRVHALIARAAAARAAVEANEVAVRILADRYEVGTATSLELSQADRDHFNALAAAIQAEADLATARAWLRLSAGLAHDAPAPMIGGAR